MRVLILLSVLAVVACSVKGGGFSKDDKKDLLKILLNLAEEKKSLAITEKSLRAVSQPVFRCTAKSSSKSSKLSDMGTIQFKVDPKAKCKWTICAPTGKHIKLTFKAPFGPVSIFNGNRWQKYGKSKPSQLTSIDECMTIQLVAGVSGVRKVFKFKAEFDTVSSSRNVVSPAPAPSQGNSGLNPKKCERKLNIKRIMKGDKSKQGQWPWMAHILTLTPAGEYMQCGGSLINNQWIVTAAHCLEHNGQWITKSSSIEVILGQHRLNVYNDKAKKVTASTVIVHPFRTIPEQGVGPYDIALIKLSKTTSFNAYVNAVSIGQLPTGTSCYTSGWGKTHMDRDTSSILRHVQMSIISNAECKNVYGVNIGDDVMCAKRKGPRGDTCQGDSGGPLMCPQEDGVYLLVGVVTFGFPCGMFIDCTPGVFASTEYFRSWITKTIKDN